MAADISVFGDHLKYAFGKFVDELVASSSNKPVAKSAPAAAPADVPEVASESVTGPLVQSGVAMDRAEVEKLGIVALRALAKDNGVELKKKSEILDAFEEAGFFSTSAPDVADEDDEEDETEDEDETDDEEEDEDDEEGLTREDLEEKSLRELRTIAKENGHAAADIKGLDQDALIDLLLEEEEDEADEDEDEDADDDDEEVEIDRETLEAMSDAELKEIASQFSIKLPKKANRKTIINTILDAAEEADDEDE